MPLDTSIYGQLRPFRIRDPLETRANALQVQAAEQANALNALKAQALQDDRANALADEDAMRAYYQAGGGTQNLNALNARPRLRAAEEKRLLDVDKERAGLGKTQAETRSIQQKSQIEQLTRSAQMLRSANDQASWSQLRQIITNEAGPEVAAQFPEQFDPRVRDAFLSATLKESERLQNETSRRGQDMTDARTRAEGAANRAVQMRGQNMTDARERERIAITRENADKKAAPKPIPTSALKLQQEEIDALQTFSGLDADLASIQQQLKAGQLQLGPLRNLESAARNRIGLSDEQSRNFESLKAKLENMRNAILLLNKGVQTEGDAQRAMNELISNLNDPKVVQQRLDEIRQINRRAANIRKNNVNVLRQNFGAEPLDYDPLENQPSAVGTQQGGPRPGQVVDGYRFKGGNPADPKSWERQ